MRDASATPGAMTAVAANIDKVREAIAAWSDRVVVANHNHPKQVVLSGPTDAIAEVEAHYACYPPGAGYLRHVDRFRDDAARVISLVLYLNDDWRDGDGGALRIYATRDARESACDLAPRGGTLVAMRSEAIPHEVLPAIAERWSISGWLRRRPARSQMANGMQGS